VPQKIYRRSHLRAVRVKWCGKSAPRLEQSGWQGKPHVEQDQIGEEERPAPLRLPGRLLEPISNGGSRGMVAARFIAGTETGLQNAQVHTRSGKAGLYFNRRGPWHVADGYNSKRTPSLGALLPDQEALRRDQSRRGLKRPPTSFRPPRAT
jgi:hypothetical protein